ncbi:MAG: hypothetical protein EAZ15_01195 [Sphingobacteriales bacterium]|nr:MAG: hypothetical protein EAZ15_01195 [Sphingobacteriales bacterium]
MGVNLKFAVVEPRDSVFYLNKESFTLIEPNFYYKLNFSGQKKDYKWEAIPKIKNFLTFNAVHYKPDFGIHNTNSSKEQVTITKEPIIKFLFNGLGKDEIKKHINAICALLSFFSGRDINYQFSKIYDGNGEFVEVKNIPNTYSDYYHGMFMYEIRNPFNLIESVNAPFFILNIEFITNCIRRFNTALQLEGESKFMLLYNVIEQIRNHYVETNKTSNNYKVVDSYQFNDENSATEIIKKSLNEISEFVKLELKSSFISEIPNKTKDIKRLTMKNQFNSLFIHLKIDPENYMIDFKALFSLRNEIFHGNPVSDIEMLNKVNNFQCLPKFTGMLMLKFMGVNSLKDIKKVAN